MRSWIRCLAMAGLVGSLAWPVGAAIPGTDLVIPAAARGGGAEGSLWTSAIYMANPNEETATVTLSWVHRSAQLTPPDPVTIDVAPGATVTLDDPMLDQFGLEEGGGAFRLQADQAIVASAAILNRAGGVEFGQGFEAVPTAGGISSGGSGTAVGVSHTDAKRSNVYLMDVSGSGSFATVEVIDADGVQVARRDYGLGAWQPVLQSLDALGVQDLASGTVRISVAAGAVVGGVSRVDNASGDPITFAVSTQPPPPGGLAPADIVGRSYTFTAIDPVAGLVVSEVAFESATTGTIFEFGENRPFTYADYETVTDLATMVMTIPARQVENMRVILEWSGADEGIFAGVVETPEGPYATGGTFVDITEP
jgi:hypothetical protein